MEAHADIFLQGCCQAKWLARRSRADDEFCSEQSTCHNDMWAYVLRFEDRHFFFGKFLSWISRRIAKGTVSVDASACSKSGLLLVTLSIQSVMTSWNNFGRWQGWFECRQVVLFRLGAHVFQPHWIVVQGPAICAARNPTLWLTNGSASNLTFLYEPDFWNIGTGKGDYRMRFLGTTSAVSGKRSSQHNQNFSFCYPWEFGSV